MLLNVERLANVAGIMGALSVGREPSTVAICVLKKGEVQREVISSLSEQVRRYHDARYPNSSSRVSDRFNHPLVLRAEDLFEGLNPKGRDELDKKLLLLLDGKSSRKVLVTCDHPDAYAYVCERLGVSRADHIALAEKSPLPNDIKSDERFRGTAHKLLEWMNPAKDAMEVYCGDSIQASANMLEHINRLRDRIPYAKKFLLGNIEDGVRFPAGHIYARNFRLPYDECLFEYGLDARHTDTGVIKRGREFLFLEKAVDTDIPTYRAYRLLQNPHLPDNIHLQISDYYFEWSISNSNEVRTLMHHLTPNDIHPYPMTSKIKSGNQLFNDIVFPALHYLNSPMTDLKHKEAPKRPKFGSKPRPPYFDYYVFDHKDLKRGSVFDESFELPRDYVSDRKGPRAHDREGHWRSYRSDRFTNAQGLEQWIEPTKVGHPRDGAKSTSFELK